MNYMIINAVNLSLLTGTSKANISKLTKNGKLVRNENKKYDTENLINSEYILSHGITKKEIEKYVLAISEKRDVKINRTKPSRTKKPKKQVKEKKILPKSEIKKIEKKHKIQEKNECFDDDDFEDITGLPARMMKMTMKQLVMKYGGSMQLKTWADILNKIMMASERDQKIQIRKLELIEKDFVISRIFSYIETMHNQIFNIPLSLTDHIISLAVSKKDKSRQEIIELLKKELEKLLKDCKTRISNEIDNLKSKYELKDDE